VRRTEPESTLPHVSGIVVAVAADRSRAVRRFFQHEESYTIWPAFLLAPSQRKISVEAFFRRFLTPDLTLCRARLTVLNRLTSAKVIGFTLVVLFAAAAAHWSPSHGDVQNTQAPDASAPFGTDTPDPAPKIRVNVVRPYVGSMARSETEPGNVDAFDSAQLYCNVSGYLKVQKVDIGSLVKQG